MKRLQKYNKSFAALLWLLISGSVLTAQTTAPPRVFLLNGRLLQEQKQQLAHTKPPDALRSALAELEADAHKALSTKIVSLVTKQATPPSGDKHDYMSQAPYFWRNPSTPNGLPYIRRDGERNPEIKQYPDHELLDKMADTVELLATAYYFTGQEEYATRAGEILRLWFLDAPTRMNPNLQFAQAIPGLNTGRGIGIIESRGLTQIVDAVGLLSGAKDWSKADQAGLEAWFEKYLQWLSDSANGRDENAAKNNHGTIYDMQVVSFALFTGKKDFAKKVLETARQKRIALQIEPDGRQPLELERTKSWSYSTMNLAALVSLAALGEKAGVDLWNFQTTDGRGIRQAINYLYPFASGTKKWEYQQIEPLEPERLFSSMRLAARQYHDAQFAKMLATLPPSAAGKHILLNF